MPAREYDCRVNHKGSLKAMESEVVVGMLKRAEEKSLNIISLTTDEDCSTHAKCAKEPTKKV